MLKRCAACGESKPHEDFSHQAKSKDGRYPYCKACAKVRQRALYQVRDNKYRAAFKRCSWCLTDVPSEGFKRTPDGKRRARCAECEKDIEAKQAQGLRRCNVCREWLAHDIFYASHLRKEHLTCMQCTRQWHRNNRPNRRVFELAKQYGITADQYDALVAKQGDKCPICLDPLPPDRGGHVDHAHGGAHKGKIRAILHRDCNRFVMWTHEDSAQLRRAADLIDSPLTDWIVAEPTLNERRREKERKR
jgi:Recombination endonuclease VII